MLMAPYSVYLYANNYYNKLLQFFNKYYDKNILVFNYYIFYLLV